MKTVIVGAAAGGPSCAAHPLRPDESAEIVMVEKGPDVSYPNCGLPYHNGMELIRIGEMQGGPSARAETVAQVWRDAGFNVKTYGDINQLVWEKFICNVTFSASLHGLRPYRVGEKCMADPHSWKIALTCGLEASRGRPGQGHRLFIRPTPRSLYHRLRQARSCPRRRPSMLLDHHARRRFRDRCHQRHGPRGGRGRSALAAPYNEVVCAIVRSREMAF